jgi:Hemerythrin HHE cation binding domain
VDITELILEDHHLQRRLFAQLEDLPRSDTASLGAVWKRLSTALETHAAAEEELFYPVLLKIGTGAGGESLEEEVLDVIKDHNQIRDAIREADAQETGSDAWWAAVEKTNRANSDHMAEEEREDLTDFRRNAPLQLRHDIAVAFAAFEGAHLEGVPAVDRDPGRYVEEHR